MNSDLKEKLHNLINQLPDENAPLALAALQTLDRAPDQRGNFTALLGLEVVAAENGRAHTRLNVQTHLLNRIGILHGGVAYSMADVTTGIAGLSAVTAGQRIVTQDLHYRYHGMVKEGSIDAHAEVIHLGTRTLVVHAKLFTGEVLIGSADGTFALVSQQEIDR